jgi:16S rRNA (cytidine1402-2'-O)-methyltransferase
MPLNSHMTEASSSRGGILYVVATPIGNPADLSLRALEILKTVDFIAAEDTRHTRRLLSHHDIGNKLISCHEHNETERVEGIIEKLSSGMNAALATDAGTPAVSDPGYRLVVAAAAAGIRIIPIPGPSAAMAALSASGLPSDAFFFDGFLPSRSSRRQERMKAIADIPGTLIFYESAKRIIATLADALEIFGDRDAVLAREMTKTHEEFIRGRISEILAELEDRRTVKGEITLLVAAGSTKKTADPSAIRDLIIEGLKSKTGGAASLAKEISKTCGISRQTVYDMILEIKNQNQPEGEGEETHG